MICTVRLLRPLCTLGVLFGTGVCGAGHHEGTLSHQQPTSAPSANTASGVDTNAAHGARLPLILVADVDLPGRATRFDYQDIDKGEGHLVVSHMNDGSVVIVNLSDGSVVKELKGIPVARGVAVADDVGIIFVTSSPNTLVLIDNKALAETARVRTGNGPDGVGWDPANKVVGVSDQDDGALSLIPNAGRGARRQIKLGRETGNVVFDPARGWFWITVVAAAPPDRLVAVDPRAAQVKQSIDVRGCNGAHGLRLSPDGQSAFIACEGNNLLARVGLGSDHAISVAPTGAGPDVLGFDLGLGWLYVAAESGDLTLFDINRPGLALLGHETPGKNSHSVAVDPATHRLFFPIMKGPKGTPVLRIMRPLGT